ncbi:hypothetical protein [Dyella jiangningensis]
MIIKALFFAAGMAGVAQAANMARSNLAHSFEAQKNIVAQFTVGPDGRFPPSSSTVAGYASDPSSILR